MNVLERELSKIVQSQWGLIVAVVVGLLLAGLYIGASFQIVRRAGYPGLWFLFWMLPGLGMIFEAGLAFGKWPSRRGS